MIQNELINIIKNCPYLIPGLLYHDLIVLKENNGFDDKNIFLFLFSLTLYKKDSLNQSSYLNICKCIQDPKIFKKLETDGKKIISDFDYDWIQVNPKEKPNAGNDNNLFKIYLSIDNMDLHLFATKLLISCSELKYNDLYFKINNDSEINRRDNVVIYCNAKNFSKYIDLIQKILVENPHIQFNSPNLLAIPYDDKIYCGMDFDDGKTSFTSKICRDIIESKKAKKSIEEIIQQIYETRKEVYIKIYDLIDPKIKNR